MLFFHLLFMNSVDLLSEEKVWAKFQLYRVSCLSRKEGTIRALHSSRLVDIVTCVRWKIQMPFTLYCSVYQTVITSLWSRTLSLVGSGRLSLVIP